MLASGALLAFGSALRLFQEFEERTSVAGTVLFTVSSLARLVGGLLLVLALVTLYVRRAPQMGSFGFAAVVVAGAGTILMCAVYWMDVFLAPTAVTVAPEILDAEASPGALRFGLLLSHVVFGIGWILAGIALLRAHVYGHVGAIAVMVGGALSLLPFLSAGELVLGLAVVWLGFTPAYANPAHYRRHEPADA
ncbi:MAG: hypothetical protein JWQ68_2020 [Cryobacterium sp.]|nr:hypothetical protein [Cryobacterium sp.]